MNIIKPEKSLFSDSRLHILFNKQILQSIIHFDEVWYEFCDKVEEIDYSDIYSSYLLTRNAKQIISELKDQVVFINTTKSSKYFQEELWKLTTKKNTCEICGNKRRHLEKAHILQKSAFKNNKLKPKTIYKEYIDSMANIILLCNNCHSDLDNGRCANSKINRIISSRNVVNSKILKMIQKDMCYMKDVMNEIERIEIFMRESFSKEINKFLYKRTTLPKSLIQKMTK